MAAHCIAIVCRDSRERARERPDVSQGPGPPKVNGVWIAIPTPFTIDGSRVDEDTLTASVDYSIESLRVDGIFCGGAMGDNVCGIKEPQDRKHLLRVQELAADRIGQPPQLEARGASSAATSKLMR